MMKGVVSLLPSGTETVIELGYRDRLLGVSHECEVGCGLDVVTFGKFDGEGVTQREIGALYEASRSDAFLFEGWEVEKSLVKFRLCSYYWTDVDKLMELRPDVIVTVVDETDLVAFEEVELAVKALLEKNDVAIVNFNPSSVAQTWQLTKELATLMGDPKHGIDYVRQSQQSLVQASSPSSAIASQSVAVVQWLDPLYMSGAWVPELVQYTGAADAFCKPGQPSQSLTWTQVSRTNPDVIVVALCALTVDQTEKEVQKVMRKDRTFASLNAVQSNHIYVVDAVRLFSCPSPKSLIATTNVLTDILQSKTKDFHRSSSLMWKRVQQQAPALLAKR